jgi:glycerol kinase
LENKGKTTYALEGGSVLLEVQQLQWMRMEQKWLKQLSWYWSFGRNCSDNVGVYFVPALAGLGAPCIGITQLVQFLVFLVLHSSHIARATIEG